MSLLQRIIIFNAALWGIASCQNAPKPVTAVLNSNWPQTPLLLEARLVNCACYYLDHLPITFFVHSPSEFIASQDKIAFWKFIEATKDIYSTVTTDKGSSQLQARTLLWRS